MLKMLKEGINLIVMTIGAAALILICIFFFVGNVGAAFMFWKNFFGG